MIPKQEREEKEKGTKTRLKSLFELHVDKVGKKEPTSHSHSSAHSLITVRCALCSHRIAWTRLTCHNTHVNGAGLVEPSPSPSPDAYMRFRRDDM